MDRISGHFFFFLSSMGSSSAFVSKEGEEAKKLDCNLSPCFSFLSLSFSYLSLAQHGIEKTWKSTINVSRKTRSRKRERKRVREKEREESTFYWSGNSQQVTEATSKWGHKSNERRKKKIFDAKLPFECLLLTRKVSKKGFLLNEWTFSSGWSGPRSSQLYFLSVTLLLQRTFLMSCSQIHSKSKCQREREKERNSKRKIRKRERSANVATQVKFIY